MTIGLLFAMQEELDAFLNHYENYETKTHKHLKIYTLQENNHTLVCVLTGIGKVNAAYATSYLIHAYDVRMILNSGVAGGVNTEVETLVLSEGVVYHDVDVTVFNYERGQVPGFKPYFEADSALLEIAETIASEKNYPYQRGKIASGDQFITERASINPILALYDDIYAIEMEATAIGHVARLEGVPFLIIRAISDVIGGSNQASDFKSFLEKSALRSAILLDELLKRL